MTLVEFHEVSKSFGNTNVLNDLSLCVQDGDLAVLFGAPASGKSVLLRALVGLETLDRGRISIRGVDASTLKPGERNIGYVPQAFALFPDKSVRQNIAYPLTAAGDRSAIKSREVTEVASLLGIDMLLDRTPSQLSGGQKQRVAIARGLVRETEIFVLDDPLVGLDFKLREQLVDDLRSTRDALGATFIYATSDASEALALGSKVAMLSNGTVTDYDEPFQLYRSPQKLQTMTDLCFPAANVLPGTLIHQAGRTRVQTALGTFDAALDTKPSTSDVRAVVRAEHVQFQGTPPVTVALQGPASVTLREDLGAEEVVYLEDAGSGTPLTGVLRSHVGAPPVPSNGLRYYIDARDLIVFSGEDRIGQGAR